MLIVAVHDVAPSTLTEVDWLLDRLDAAGVERRVLKVIPAEPDASPELTGRLEALVRREASAGSEVVLHGWSHRADGALRGAALDRLRARAFASDAAEFLTLDRAEVRRRLEDGKRRLEAWGASVVGFCPPAWLATDDLAPAAEELGLRYLVTLRGLRDLRRRRRVDLPPVGYMGSGGAQEALVQLGGALVAEPLRMLIGRDVHRLFLHPQGASRSGACHRVLERISGLAATHPPATYAELLDG